MSSIIFKLIFSITIWMFNMNSKTHVTSYAVKDNLFPLSIIHLNDFHTRFEEFTRNSTRCKDAFGKICIGGYARVITTVKKLLEQRRNEGKNPIYLNIGDNFQGTLWYHLLGWNVTQHFLNILEADATTLGNHEFDYGVQDVISFLKHLKSDVIVSNFDDSDQPEFKDLYKKSKVLIRNGRKIGLVGALVAKTMNISNTGKLHFLNEIEHVKKESEKLRDEGGVDIVIVLSHCGLDKDLEMAKMGGSAIDVIVGGHTHDLLFDEKKSQNLGPDVPKETYPIEFSQENDHKVLIVQASAYTKYLGDLTVYFDEKGEAVRWEGNPIFMSNDIVPDPTIIEELKPWKERVDKIGLIEIGEIRTLLNKSDCRETECNIGSFVTDAFVEYYKNQTDLKLKGSEVYGAIGIIKGGEIQTSLLPGIITYSDLFTAFPYRNTIDTFELQGKDLLEVINYSSRAWKDFKFLQFSGLNVTYKNVTITKNALEVVSVDVLCRKTTKYEKLDGNKWYQIIVQSFIGDVNTGIYPFKNRRNYHKGDKTDADVVAEYLRKLSPVAYEKKGRITIIN